MRSLALAGLVTLSALGGGWGAGCAEGTVGDESSSGVGGSSGSGTPLADLIDPAPGGARRLLGGQYVRAVKRVFGVTASLAAAPPDDIQLHGFASIGATDLAMSPQDVERYEASARAIAKAFVTDTAARKAVLPCEPISPTDATCLSSIASKLGHALWRRSLEPSEAGAVGTLAVQAGETYGSVDQALAYVLLALLQAPDFLYVIELGEPEAEHPERRWLTPVELVTRMSLFLLDAPPDLAWIERAEDGQLANEADLRELALEMLARPEARAALGAFYDEVFRFDRIDETVKIAERFPEWTPELQASVHASIAAFLDDLVWTRNADARTMLTAEHAFVDATLAPLYDVTVPPGSGLTKIKLSEAQQRMGLLGSVAFLSVYSHAGMTSPTKRGVFIRRTLLCDSVPPPPPEVVPKLPDDPSGPKTTKELLEEHMKNDSCKACHGLFDSLGWSLEKFDPIGRHRNDDKGQPIDTHGESPNIGSFAGPAELAGLLSEHPQVPDCMVRQLYRDSMGHFETKGEEPALEDLHRRFAEGGYRVQELLVELVASPAFRLVGEPK
ncbi:MAG: DUF1588 domain-containing protein [Deltaproteobacteria bacterium]|nr:DUF1588 domain-containing protein [Deltaproteobacteria bacterium]